jgi:hypothetical protein
MNCPHCGVAFHDTSEKIALGSDIDGSWWLIRRLCPSCKRLIFHLEQGGSQRWQKDGKPVAWEWVYTDPVLLSTTPVRPRSHHKPPCPPEVPADLATDYVEACLILHDSPRAAAALSRQCLQRVLRQYARVAPADLQTEIDWAISGKVLPAYLGETLRAVCQIGSFQAYPQKSSRAGEIAPAEPGEPEWNIVVLESLFDFLFVAPAAARRKQAAVELKKQSSK